MINKLVLMCVFVGILSLQLDSSDAFSVDINDPATKSFRSNAPKAATSPAQFPEPKTKSARVSLLRNLNSRSLPLSRSPPLPLPASRALSIQSRSLRSLRLSRPRCLRLSQRGVNYKNPKGEVLWF
ncbi:hypothetical protein Drorol1_Dr00012774 [Drosera rotundifolia]